MQQQMDEMAAMLSRLVRGEWSDSNSGDEGTPKPKSPEHTAPMFDLDDAKGGRHASRRLSEIAQLDLDLDVEQMKLPQKLRKPQPLSTDDEML